MGSFILVVGAIQTEVGPTWKTTVGDLTTSPAKIAALDFVINPNTGIYSLTDPDLGSDTPVDFTWLGSPSGACWYLDGAIIPIEFSGLPVGFTIDGAILNILAEIQNDGTASALSFVHGNWNGLDAPNEFSVPDTPWTYSEAYDILANAPFTTALDLSNTNFGVVANTFAGCLTAVCSERFILYNLYISGTYISQSWQYTLEQPERPDPVIVVTKENFNHIDKIPVPKINTGDIITVTSDPDDPLALDFTKILTITLEYESQDPLLPGTKTIVVIPDLILIIRIHLLVFLVPDLLSETPDVPPRILSIKITSTQFSGSVTLGKFITIYFFNAPGIYRLVADKTTDTLYDIDNGGTIEVQIPDPFAKTGFVGN